MSCRRSWTEGFVGGAGKSVRDLDLDESGDEGDAEGCLECERYGDGEEFLSFVCVEERSEDVCAGG